VFILSRGLGERGGAGSLVVYATAIGVTVYCPYKSMLSVISTFCQQRMWNMVTLTFDLLAVGLCDVGNFLLGNFRTKFEHTSLLCVTL